MKKQLLTAVLTITSLLTFAQTKPTIGIQAGITSASLKGDAAESFNNLIEYTGGRLYTNSKTGIYAGIDAGIPLSENFTFQPGVHYTQKGYEVKGEMNIKGVEFLSPSAKATLTSHYIEIPVLLKANFSGLELALGPQVSYLANADMKATAGVAGFNIFKKTFDATEQLNKWDAGVKAGIGYQFSNGVNISAAYNHGLIKADANENMDVFNRNFSVGLGYRF